jgi:hypothetical protein
LVKPAVRFGDFRSGKVVLSSFAGPCQLSVR